MSSPVDAHERQVATALHLANLLPGTSKPEVCAPDFAIFLAPIPFEGVSPRSIANPVTDKIRISL